MFVEDLKNCARSAMSKAEYYREGKPFREEEYAVGFGAFSLWFEMAIDPLLGEETHRLANVTARTAATTFITTLSADVDARAELLRCFQDFKPETELVLADHKVLESSEYWPQWSDCLTRSTILAVRHLAYDLCASVGWDNAGVESNGWLLKNVEQLSALEMNRFAGMWLVQARFPAVAERLKRIRLANVRQLVTIS